MAASGTTAEAAVSMNTSLQQGHLISGVHAIVFSREADKVRPFFGDVLGLPAVDAGGGWLIFATARRTGDTSSHQSRPPRVVPDV